MIDLLASRLMNIDPTDVLQIMILLLLHSFI